MKYEVYFPRGTAKGIAFCNRLQERGQIIRKIRTGQHILVMSPRRYGKTSLVKRAVSEIKLPYGESDLFIAIDAKRIEHQILSGVKQIICQVTSSLEQAVEIVSGIFRKMRSKWIVGVKGLNIALIPESDVDPAENILESLQLLEEILRKKKKRAVLFIDEVQEISEIAEGKGIEGAIRHVAQNSKYLSIIFSGSKRHLIRQMFFERSRPLFKLCARINLQRIHRKDYHKHINKIAFKTWRKKMSDASLSRIFELTELHPYYVNALCLQIWEGEKTNPPTVQEISKCWLNIVKSERIEVIDELSKLNLSQRKVIFAIATGVTQKLTSHDFLSKVDLSGSTVSDAINVLLKKDYIEKLENGEYRIIDPLIKATIAYSSKTEEVS